MTKLIWGIFAIAVLVTAGCQPKGTEVTQKRATAQPPLPVLSVSDTTPAPGQVLCQSDYDTLANVKADEYWDNGQENLEGAQKTEYSFMGCLHKDHASLMLVSLQLSELAGKLTGKYFYHKTVHKQDLRLEGTKEGDHIQLSEYAPDGSVTGSFTGLLVSGEYFEGEWRSSDGSKTFGFKMMPDGMDYQQRKKTGLQLNELEQD
jgi:hypothetical protein